MFASHQLRRCSLRHQLTAAVCALAFALTLLVTRGANAQLHGGGVQKACDSNLCVGNNLRCIIAAVYLDGFNDVLLLSDAFDIVEANPVDVDTPVTIFAVIGNASCAGGGTALPCVMGAGGVDYTATGFPQLDGTQPQDGLILFLSDDYIIDADDPDPLLDTGHVVFEDQCNISPQGCNPNPQDLQFGASTNIIDPGINIEKVGTPDGPLCVGVASDVDYTFTVTNTGDVPLLNVVVDDTNPDCTPALQSGDNNPANGQLDLTETWIYTCSVSLTPADTDPINNTATVTADAPQSTGTAQLPPVDTCSVEDSDTASVSANPIPPCDIEGPTALCEGTQNVVYTGRAGMDSYAWSTTGTGCAIDGSTTGQSVTVDFTSGTCTVFLTVTDLGCSNSCNQPITINSPRPCDITGRSEVCPNTTANYCSASVFSTYTWSIDSGPCSVVAPTNEQCVDVNFTGAGTCVIRLDGVDANQCPTTCTETVTVNDDPDCTINTGPLEVCSGSTETYCGDPGFSSYSWSTTGPCSIDGSTTGQCIDVDFTGPGTCTLFLHAEDSTGCEADCELPITVADCPVCKQIDQPKTPPDCETGGNTLTASVNNITPSTTFEWEVTSGPCEITNVSTTTITYSFLAPCEEQACCDFLLTVDDPTDNEPASTCDLTVCCTPCIIEDETCRVTGGGNSHSIDHAQHPKEATNYYTHGGQAGAPATSGSQDFGEWTHRQHNGPAGKWTFHGGTHSAPPGTEILTISCCDTPACQHAAANGNHKQISFTGVGTFKNIHQSDFGSPAQTSGPNRTFHYFTVHIEDLGEPGSPPPGEGDCPETPDAHACGEADCACPDFYRITIYRGVVPVPKPTNGNPHIDPAQLNTTEKIYEVFGYTEGGNLQIHAALGDLNADQVVGPADLTILLNNFGPTEPFGIGDLDFNLTVDSQDLAIMLSRWGPVQ